MKKLIALILSVTMVVGSLTVCTEAKTKLLTAKNVTITIGKTYNIIVEGKVKKAKSNSKVVKIKKITKSKISKVAVKAVKTGKAKVTVKVGKKKLKVSIKVIPGNPTGLTAKLTGKTEATLKWSAAKGAVSYIVYRGENNKFKLLATSKTTSYIDKQLKEGVTYSYKVKAVGSKKTESKKFTNTVSVKTYKLVWSDEFNKAELDNTKWTFNGVSETDGYGSAPVSINSEECTEVKDGKLVLKPRFKWDVNKQRVIAGETYSAKLWTKNLMTFKYGKIEFVAKVAPGNGTWSAGWMLGEKANWPACGEIDVFETTSNPLKNDIVQAAHMSKFSGMTSVNKTSQVETATKAYHTYAIEWNEKTITYLIDGKETFTYDPAKYSDLFKTTGDDVSVWPYNQPFFLVISCGVGGANGGQITPNEWTQIDEKDGIETLEDYFYIDAVRVYQ